MSISKERNPHQFGGDVDKIQSVLIRKCYVSPIEAHVSCLRYGFTR